MSSKRFNSGAFAALIGISLALAPVSALAQSSSLFSTSGSSSSSGPLPSLAPANNSSTPPATGPVVTPQSALPAGQAPTAYTGVGTTSAAGATGPSTTTLNTAVQATTNLVPFGASLFTNLTPPSNLAPNPDYVIQPGDTVSIQIYGGVTAQSSNVVDTQGNVFLPGFGPVHVAGVEAANLQAAVQKQIANAFTGNVSVYAVLQTESSVSIFVTGYVKSPGQYLGSASDSVLDFISRAGGVDPSRGSYRDIEIVHGNTVVGQVDLYAFLTTGQLSAVLESGDTIVVGKQEPMVSVGGSVRNNYLFEIPDSDDAGAEILQLAQPLPSATNVLVTGTRAGIPFSTYMSLPQLAGAALYDQDQLTFIADNPAPTITVQVQGSRIGPAVLVADRDSTLKTLLNYIAVDPRDADTKAIYIIRPGLQQQQYEAIQAALDRLQKALFFATSVTTGEAQIRATEAQEIQTYINEAHTIQPNGVLVVADDAGNIGDVRLEDGDTIVIPESSDTVMVDGEVQVPQAVNFIPGQTKAAYIASAGGLTERGRQGQTIIRRLSGKLVLDPNAPIMPGDELIVLPYVETEDFVVTQDVLSLIFQVAASTYFASKL